MAPAARVLLLLLTGLLLACGGDRESEVAMDERREVQTAAAATIVLARTESASAEVVSANESDLSADVAARVQRVHADVGSEVEAGDVILQLDATDYRLALGQAQARVESAAATVNLVERRLARVRALRERQFVSEDEVLALETELDGARANLQVARADREVAARNVDKTLIRAPFDGVVVARHAQVGALAPAGTPLLRFVELAGVEVEATVPARDGDGFGSARDFRFTSQGRSYPLELLRLSPVVDRAGRTQIVRLAFTGPRAPAGSTGTLHWSTEGQRLAPELLVRRGEALGYFRVDDGHARFVAVPDAQEGRAFPVRVEPDARIVVRGHQALQDGEAVREREVASEGGLPARDGEGAH